MRKFVLAMVLGVLSLAVWMPNAHSTITQGNKDGKNIVVEIDYGSVRPMRQAQIPCVEGNTALDVLQKAAKVKTHSVRQKIFVSAVDGVEGKRGEMAWYYAINGKPARMLACSNVLKAGDSVRWTYKKDVCSGNVDK